MKNIALIFAGLITGFLISAYIYKQKEASLPPPVSKQIFQDFIDREGNAFATAADAESKLRAADEMYGKMMVLFLAELGLKSTSGVAVSSPVLPVTVVNEGPAETTSSTVTTLDTHPAIEISQTSDAVKEVTKKSEVGEAGSYQHYNSSAFISSLTPTLKKMIGFFEGSLTHKSGRNKGRVDSIQMNFNLIEQDGSIQGEALVSMVDPSGFEYSRNSSEGSNKSFKGTNKENFIYIEASPTSYFLVDVSEFPKIIGVYFEKGQDIGTLTMRKTR